MTTRIFPRDPRTGDKRTDLEKGIVFATLCVAVFFLLLLADRPHWATPWLLASIFTFGLWRMTGPRAR
jgi:hypothetical protein